MTAEPLQSLLSRVREAKPGVEGETERSAIAKDWCALREDYPSICWLIVDALSDHRVAVGSAIALAERVLPGCDLGLLTCRNIGEPDEATVYRAHVPWTTERGTTPALALLAAILSALIAKEQTS